MISIAYCIHGLRLGGAERHLLEVIKNLDWRRYDPVVVCLGNSWNPILYKEYKACGIAIEQLNITGRPCSLETLSKIIEFARFLRARKFHIVHGYLFEGNLFGALAGRLADVPFYVISKRSMDVHDGWSLLSCKIANRLASTITANSPSVRDYASSYEKCPLDKIEVIPNGVGNGRVFPEKNSSEWRTIRDGWRIPPDCHVIGTVARFSHKKGYRYFIQAAARMLKYRQDIRFMAVGDGELRSEMEKLADSLGIRSTFVLTGWQSEVRSIMNLFDIYVCPSVIEGMSNALLDAMQLALPVVATAVGGNIYSVVDGVTGYLVPPADPVTMADTLLKLLDQPDIRKQFGKSGKRRVEREFSTTRMVHRLENLYRKLLQEKGIEVNDG